MAEIIDDSGEALVFYDPHDDEWYTEDAARKRQYDRELEDLGSLRERIGEPIKDITNSRLYEAGIGALTLLGAVAVGIVNGFQPSSEGVILLSGGILMTDGIIREIMSFIPESNF